VCAPPSFFRKKTTIILGYLGGRSGEEVNKHKRSGTNNKRGLI
jgi:hypothetical protein